MAAYKEQSAPDLVEDIHARKEFAQLWVPPGDGDFRDATALGAAPQTHQQFVRNFMNPSTPNMRMHLMHSTGCHAAGTRVRVFAARGIETRCVEDIVCGDELVHPDGSRARVCALHRGYDRMFRIVPKVGARTAGGYGNTPRVSASDDMETSPRGRSVYDVNAGHILRLYDANLCAIDISASAYAAYSAIARDLFLAYVPPPRDGERDDNTSRVSGESTPRVSGESTPDEYARARRVYVRFEIIPRGHGEYYGFTIDGARAYSSRVAAETPPLARDDESALFLGHDGLILHNSGKCLGRGTLVRTMARGLVAVEDIQRGDILVGDDGEPRVVLSLARGIDQCYRVRERIAGGGDVAGRPLSEFICNIAHILVLWDHVGERVYDCSLAYLLFTALGPTFARRDDIICSPPTFSAIRVVESRCGAGAREYYSFTIEPVGPREYFGFELGAAAVAATPCNGRFLLGDGTITHNTRAALAAAQECVRAYRYIYRGVHWRDVAQHAPAIFIIAFGGKSAFVRDLIKYPEYGYASADEYVEFVRLQRESVDGEAAYDKYRAYYAGLKRRFMGRAHGGFYRMFGYDEFANRLFGADVAKLTGIIADARARHEPYARALERAIAAREVTPDASLMARLENSMLIADEIHNTYNAQTINNRGLALQYVLDNVRGVRFLSLSATPINSAPAEICDFINYFVGREDKVMREGMFAGRALLPGAIERVSELLRGHISFLYDFDARYFPRRVDRGVALRIAGTPRNAVMQELPYLRFAPCVMSDYFVETIRAFYRARDTEGREDDGSAADDDARDVDMDDDIIGIPQNAYSLFDMVFPNPAADNIGLYNSATLFSALHSAPAEWKARVGVATKIVGGMQTYGGEFLRASSLARYSAKYAEMVALIPRIIRETGPCKIMIYHERVRATGVMLIREILRENGAIGDSDDATADTLCAICARARRVHNIDNTPRASDDNTSRLAESDDADFGTRDDSTRDDHRAHEYRPLRFATIYSELDKSTITSIRERYNSAANARGEWCSILIGSRLIRESYDFMAVRHLIILSLPVSVSQLIQVFGRCVRRGSHSQLPARDRDVHAHILINVAGARATTTPRRIRDEEHADAFEVRAIDDSPEVRRYALKLESYLIIQKIERELARGAVDAGINRNIITRPDRDSLGFMTYDEPVRFVLRPGELRVDTFFAYGYGAQEIQFAIDIIKRLFARQSVWFARDLIGAVRAPPFGVWSNPALISDASITIALAFLISASSNATSIGERAVIVGGAQFLVVASGGASRGARAVGLRDDDCFFLAPVETVEVAGIARSRALVDVESFMRGAHYESEDVIPIDQFELRTSFEESILATLRADFAGASLRERGAKSARVIDIARMRGFLVLFSADQQRIVAQQMVENAALRDEFGALYDFLDALGLFIHWRYVSKYRDVARRFTSAARDDETPVAYGDGGSVRIFSGEEWFSVGRAALNMHTEYTENAIVVGIYHQFPYNVKFQLREPIHKLRALRMRGAKLRDARTIERGSVCVTKSRRAIEHSAQRLGIRAREIKAARTSGQLCAIIQLNLLGKEIEARRARSAMKFVYGWWNAVPSATA